MQNGGKTFHRQLRKKPMKPDAHSSSEEKSLFTGFAGTKTGEASIMCISSACMGWDILVDSSIGRFGCCC